LLHQDPIVLDLLQLPYPSIPYPVNVVVKACRVNSLAAAGAIVLAAAGSKGALNLATPAAAAGAIAVAAPIAAIALVNYPLQYFLNFPADPLAIPREYQILYFQSCSMALIQLPFYLS
jgi:hypothetical protein